MRTKTIVSDEPKIEPKRSALMARVRPKNSKPEIAVRQMLHAMGYRFRLHARELPGRPDIVFRPKKKVIFVHGCFWHRHSGCRKATTPKTRKKFWDTKFAANKARDARVQEELLELGYSYLVVWECEIKDERALSQRIRFFLN